MPTSFHHLNPDKIPAPAWQASYDSEFSKLADSIGAGQAGLVQSLGDALQVADSAASFFRGRFRSATGMWFERRGEFIDLPWHGDYLDKTFDGSPKSTSIAAEVEALAAEILPLVPDYCEVLPCPHISLSHEQFNQSTKRQMQATAVEVLLMVDGFLTAISRAAPSKAIDWLSAAYMDLLACIELASEIIGTPRDSARAAALVRHRENREMKSQVFEWLDANRSNHPSMDKCAEVISRTVVPIAFRTARNWVGDWAKDRQSARTE